MQGGILLGNLICMALVACRWVHVLFMLFVSIYVYLFPNLFLYQMMFVSFISNTTGVTSGTETAYPSGAPLPTLGF
jgi:hypothetical protein